MKLYFDTAYVATHLVSARAAGFSEIWTTDRHLLRAARHFGLKGRSL